MGVTLPSRRWPRILSIPAFGLFSLIVVFCFSLVYLNNAFPGTGNSLPTETGELSVWQGYFFLSFSAGESAALSGMLFWGLLIVRPWQWLQTQHWSRMALFGGLIGLIEIICTSCMMWAFYFFFLFFLTTLPSIKDVISLLVVLPLGSIGLGIFTLAIMAVMTKGLVFVGGITTGMGCALLARRIFS